MAATATILKLVSVDFKKNGLLNRINFDCACWGRFLSKIGVLRFSIWPPRPPSWNWLRKDVDPLTTPYHWDGSKRQSCTTPLHLDGQRGQSWTTPLHIQFVHKHVCMKLKFTCLIQLTSPPSNQSRAEPENGRNVTTWQGLRMRLGNPLLLRLRHVIDARIDSCFPRQRQWFGGHAICPV
jgi:hypothetical protein